LETRGGFPVRPKHLAECLLQQLDGLEDSVGQLSSELFKPSLYQVEFGRVGRSRRRKPTFSQGRRSLPNEMAWSTIEHDEQMVVGVGFGEPLEETLQAPALSIPGR
jgi:hypothetical protein